MIHTHTMSQLKTVQEPMKLLKATNVTNVAAASLPIEVPTLTAPITTGSCVVISSSALNYLKLVPILSTNTVPTGQAIRVTGYSISDAGFYIPQLLFYGSASAMNTTATTTVGGSIMYAVATLNKTEGDAKIYSSTTSKSTSFLLIDTLGCQLLKIEFVGASGTSNAFYGAM